MKDNESTVAMLRFWLTFLACVLTFLLGAELMAVDLNRHGYNVPHLWQKLEHRK